MKGAAAAITRDDLLAQVNSDIPTIFRYATHAKHDSVYNTPPTFAVYLLRNFLAWAKAEGGLTQLEARNREKARAIYETVDRHPDLYRCAVDSPSNRSRMNVVFRLPSAALEAQFLIEAEAGGFIGIKNHPAVGGLRISLYNGISIDDVYLLRDFMEEFADNYYKIKYTSAARSPLPCQGSAPRGAGGGRSLQRAVAVS